MTALVLLVLSASFFCFANTGTAYADSGCLGARPSILNTATAIRWNSYSDYVARRLTVDFNLACTTGQARSVLVQGASASNGVALLTPVPLSLGDLNPGDGAVATLTYDVPAGVSQFKTSMQVTAADDCGYEYSYPDVRCSMSTTDDGLGRVTVHVNWDTDTDPLQVAKATVKYRLYPSYPQDGGQPDYVTAGTIQHGSNSDSLTLEGLLPGRFYDFMVEVVDQDGREQAPRMTEPGRYLRDDRFAFLNLLNNTHPGNFDEVRVRDYHNGGLYWYSAMTDWESGLGFEYLWLNNTNYEYAVIRGKAAWQSVVDHTNNRIYIAGEMPRPEGDHHYRSMIGVIDENTNTGSFYLIPNTDDCNELIGIALDAGGNRLLAGERRPGTPLTSSLWPSGGGLWSIPLETIDQPATYSRVYQDLYSRTWDKMTVFNGRLYVTLFNGGYEALMSAALSDIPAAGQMPASALTLELPPGVNSMLNSPYHGLVVGGGRIDHQLTLYINDGSGWQTIESNHGFPGEGLYELPDHRFLVTWDENGSTHHAGVASVTGEWEYLGLFPGGWPSYNYATGEDGSIYYATSYPGKVWKVTYTP